MKSYQQKISMVIIMTFLLSSLAFAVERPTSSRDNWVESRVCYGKLYKIKQKTDSTMVIFVNNRQFTITEKTPVLFERAQKLINKEVQVIYNNKNSVVINLFDNHRQEPI